MKHGMHSQLFSMNLSAKVHEHQESLSSRSKTSSRMRTMMSPFSFHKRGLQTEQKRRSRGSPARCAARMLSMGKLPEWNSGPETKAYLARCRICKRVHAFDQTYIRRSDNCAYHRGLLRSRPRGFSNAEDRLGSKTSHSDR
jgi:hypothetical protein